MEKLLSVEESAARLGLKAVTIRLWASQRKIASCRLGKRRLIPESEIIRLIETNLTPALPDRANR